MFRNQILPLFHQADDLYYAVNQNLLQELQVMQNRCLRMIFGRKHWPGTILAHQQCNILLTKDRRRLNLLKVTHPRSFKLEN